jgi:hypothetical protein
MRTIIAKPAIAEPVRSGIYLGALLLLRAVGQVILYQRGFIRVAADEFARGIYAVQWASHPKFDLLENLAIPWLPFERYLNGAMLTIWPNPLLAPRVTVFLSSCLALIALYAFVYLLFNSFTIAVLTSMFVTLQPWFAWLSGTPMLEMYYLAFYLAGLFFLVAWLRDNRKGFWILAGCSFLLSSGFHVQSWILINVANFLTLGFLFRFVRQKNYGYAGRLIAYYFLSNAFIIAIIIIEFANTGEALAFLTAHTSYSKWFYGGYNVSTLEKFLYYPRLILDNVNPIIWPLFITALIFLRSDRNRGWKLFPLMLAVLTLVIVSVMNIFSGPPSAAPARYSLFYLLMLSPYVAYGTYHLFNWGNQRPLPIARYSITVLTLALYIYSLGWGVIRTSNHQIGPRETIAAGNYLNELLSQGDLDGEKTYMVELVYWDYLVFQLMAGHHEAVVYDRKPDLQDRKIPSIFEQPPASIYDILSAQNVRYVALRNPELKMKVLETEFLSAQQDLGRWTIYEFEP